MGLTLDGPCAPASSCIAHCFHDRKVSVAVCVQVCLAVSRVQLAPKHRPVSFLRVAVAVAEQEHLSACTTTAVPAHAVSTRRAAKPHPTIHARLIAATAQLPLPPSAHPPLESCGVCARSCARIRRAPSVRASRDTRTMSCTAAPRAAATTPPPKRRTRPPTRTGSAERRKSWMEESRCAEAWEARSYTAADMAAWASENDGPIAGLVEDVAGALERLECRRAGQDKGTGRHAISVRHASFGRSLSPVLVTACPQPT